MSQRTCCDICDNPIKKTIFQIDYNFFNGSDPPVRGRLDFCIKCKKLALARIDALVAPLQRAPAVPPF